MTISETATPPNTCIADRANHAATLGSVFCVPPSHRERGVRGPAGSLTVPGRAARRPGE